MIENQNSDLLQDTSSDELEVPIPDDMQGLDGRIGDRENTGYALPKYGEIIGVIRIPAMDLELPLFWGASSENLAKGAAVMGEGDYPGAGIASNCVAAGHRGYMGSPFFREIEKLKKGDLIQLTVLSSQGGIVELSYRAEEIRIIEPYDIDAIKGRDGEELLTLLTCHPYRSHGKYRYLVYCRRCEAEESISSGETIASDESTLSRQSIMLDEISDSKSEQMKLDYGEGISQEEVEQYEQESAPWIWVERRLQYLLFGFPVLFLLLAMRKKK